MEHLHRIEQQNMEKLYAEISKGKDKFKKRTTSEALSACLQEQAY
jgi:hypothetical protein